MELMTRELSDVKLWLSPQITALISLAWTFHRKSKDQNALCSESYNVNLILPNFRSSWEWQFLSIYEWKGPILSLPQFSNNSVQEKQFCGFMCIVDVQGHRWDMSKSHHSKNNKNSETWHFEQHWFNSEYCWIFKNNRSSTCRVIKWRWVT